MKIGQKWQEDGRKRVGKAWGEGRKRLGMDRKMIGKGQEKG